MNKHHGSKFEDYLKEKGAFEEVSALTQKRWEELQTEKPSNPPGDIEASSGPINKFFQWIRCFLKQSPLL